MEDLDVIQSYIPYFDRFKIEIRNNFKENLKIIDEENWKQGQNYFVTIYKLVKINIDYDNYKLEVKCILSIN